jgi:hypothetical protein
MIDCWQLLESFLMRRKLYRTLKRNVCWERNKWSLKVRSSQAGIHLKNRALKSNSNERQPQTSFYRYPFVVNIRPTSIISNFSMNLCNLAARKFSNQIEFKERFWTLNELLKSVSSLSPDATSVRSTPDADCRIHTCDD